MQIVLNNAGKVFLIVIDSIYKLISLVALRPEQISTAVNTGKTVQKNEKLVLCLFELSIGMFAHIFPMDIN